jgi:hypothetical protein
MLYREPAGRDRAIALTIVQGKGARFLSYKRESCKLTAQNNCESESMSALAAIMIRLTVCPASHSPMVYPEFAGPKKRPACEAVPFQNEVMT